MGVDPTIPMQDCSIPASQLLHLFDAVPDVGFFVKDASGRYTHINLTLVRRVGLKRRSDVVGRRPSELFPSPLGESYEKQDRQVLRGRDVNDQLEVHHPFGNHISGWCLTRKFAIHDEGRIIGLAGLSRSLRTRDPQQTLYPRLMLVMDHIHAHLDEPVRVTELAQLADTSVAQLERTFAYVFQITPAQMLIKMRIDRAMEMLAGDQPIVDIAPACGYSDQSAFTRQFRKVTGLTPGQYQLMCRRFKQEPSAIR